MQTPKNYCKSKSLRIFLDFSRKRVFAGDFRWVICLYLATFLGFCVVLVRHSSSFRGNSSQVAPQSRSWNVKRRWPHRYELIDFPCSLHSSDFADFLSVWPFSFNNRDNLHEKFRLANRCATRTPTVIRLTALFANNSARNWRRFISVRHSKMRTISLSLSVRARYLIFSKGTEKCVHSPSIHHAISRQKLSINQSARQSNRRKGRRINSEGEIFPTPAPLNKST